MRAWLVVAFLAVFIPFAAEKAQALPVFGGSPLALYPLAALVSQRPAQEQACVTPIVEQSSSNSYDRCGGDTPADFDRPYQIKDIIDKLPTIPGGLLNSDPFLLLAFAVSYREENGLPITAEDLVKICSEDFNPTGGGGMASGLVNLNHGDNWLTILNAYQVRYKKDYPAIQTALNILKAQATQYAKHNNIPIGGPGSGMVGKAPPTPTEVQPTPTLGSPPPINCLDLPEAGGLFSPEPINQQTAKDNIKYAVFSLDAYHNRDDINNLSKQLPKLSIPGSMAGYAQKDWTTAMAEYAQSIGQPIPTNYMKGVEDSGFSATIYKNATTIVIAYRGTVPTVVTTLSTDVHARFWAAFLPVPRQYEAALKLAQEVRETCSTCTVTLTGHSLGGGLASYVGSVMGDKVNKVVTFNGARNAFSASGNNLNQLNVIVPGDPIGDARACYQPSTEIGPQIVSGANALVGIVEFSLAGKGVLTGRTVTVTTTQPHLIPGTNLPAPSWWTNPGAGLDYTHSMVGILGGMYNAARGDHPHHTR